MPFLCFQLQFLKLLKISNILKLFNTIMQLKFKKKKSIFADNFFFQRVIQPCLKMCEEPQYFLISIRVTVIKVLRASTTKWNPQKRFVQ